MKTSIAVAVLGSTGYVGLELVKILEKHPNISINFLGTENFIDTKINELDVNILNINLPNLKSNEDFDPKNCDVVFLALPHGISNKYVNKLFNSIKIIDLSADFRLDYAKNYTDNYNENHICLNILDKFVYGLAEINKSEIKNSSNIAIPGCYPTSILLPLIPLIKNNFIENDNIIIDSKSGYSGAGKNFHINNIKNMNDYNFYNYNTNDHRHICEIQQELNKNSNTNVQFSFNPHILPLFRGMMSTIYCNLRKNTKFQDINSCLEAFSNKHFFVNFISNDTRADLFSVQKTNYCNIKLFKHYSENKIIIVSVIDNLIKGAAGQAVQCLNIMYKFDESLGLY